MADKIKVTIDGQSVEVEPGTTILNAARQIGGDIVPPAMCYYSKLKGSGGKCRTCLVKVAQGSEKDPRPMPKLVASCQTQVMDGMVVENTTSPEVLEARKGVVEMLLINHPLDCPVCDQAGECDLQNLSFEHGASNSRYEFERRTFDKVDIGDKIQLHINRCILCYRCVYTADQLTGKREHGVLDRGDHAAISTCSRYWLINCGIAGFVYRSWYTCLHRLRTSGSSVVVSFWCSYVNGWCWCIFTWCWFVDGC
jgi:NADH-quinone oxidoreductase subunit G